MDSHFKIDTKHNILWDLSEGIVYSIVKENDDFITISHDNHVGLFFKRTNSIIIPAKYDAIGGPFGGSIPDEIFKTKPLPFEIHLENYIGIGSVNGVLLEPLIDENEYRVYTQTFSEGIVAVELANDEMTLHPKYHFLDTGNGNLSGFTFCELRSNFKDGKATVSNGNLIMEVDSDFEIIRDHPSYSIGFNDEIYPM